MLASAPDIDYIIPALSSAAHHGLRITHSIAFSLILPLVFNYYFYRNLLIEVGIDEGKLDWDKPVRDYLPGFRLQDAYATANLRPRDLVTHQSGLPRHDVVWYGSPLSRQELFDRLLHLEPSKPPHAKFQYNNLMYLVAGVLIERVSGLRWEEFVRRRILDPLEMKHSWPSRSNRA